MKIYSVSIFAEGSAVPEFSPLFGYEGCVILHIRSGKTNPEVTIFFDNHQEAINFKNAIHQSWETFLRKGNSDE